VAQIIPSHQFFIIFNALKKIDIKRMRYVLWDIQKVQPTDFYKLYVDVFRHSNDGSVGFVLISSQLITTEPPEGRIPLLADTFRT